MAEQPGFAEGHAHREECAQLYAEWRRYHAVVVDLSGHFDRAAVLTARRERDSFEHRLRLIGCSGEALRRLERDAEIAAHGRPTLEADEAATEAPVSAEVETAPRPELDPAHQRKGTT